MKKLLLTISTFAAGVLMAQMPSPSWTISQNSNFPMTSAGTRFLDAVSPNVVWAIGYDGTAPSMNYNYFTRTTNGGTSFNSGVIFTSTANPSVGDTNTWVLGNLDAVDANTAWVSAYKKVQQAQGAIFKTTNGGANWVNMNAPGMFTNTASFTDIVCFLTPSIGITMGDPHAGNNNEFEIWRTTNGGLTWSLIPGSSIPNALSGEYGLVNVYGKQGANNIWFGTNKGRIYRSTDGGLTWAVGTVPSVPSSSADVNDIAFTDPFNGVAYVYNTSTSPATFEVYNTTDGGATWVSVPVDPNLGQNDISAVPGTNYFVSAGAGSGNNIISYSTDNGVTWTDWGSTGIQYLNVDFADASNGWSGSFSDPNSASLGGIWKYNGAALTSTAVPPTSSFNVPSQFCLSGSNFSLTPNNTSTGTGPLTYSWSASTGVILSSSTASAPAITFTANGTYTITLAATNTVNTNTSSQVVQVLTCSAPSANYTVMTGTLCAGSAISFSNTSAPGSPAPTYSWSTNATSGVIINPSSTAVNASITFSNAGTYTVTLTATNAGGTSQSVQTVTVQACPNGIASISLAESLLVYPNPAKDILNVQVEGADTYAVTLINLLGKTVISEKNKSSLDVSNLTPGIYFLTIEAKGQKTTKKIVVE